MRLPWTLCALALLAFPALAGCLDTSGPATGGGALPEARLVAVGGQPNQQATQTPVARQANELSIAVNPTDPRNIIATGKDYTPDQAGSCVWDGIYASHDGGATWKDANLLGSPWHRMAQLQAGQVPDVPNDLSRFYCATDPVVEFGPDGTAYWAVMPYQCDPGSGGKTGSGAIPPGGFNDWLWTCSSMYVLASSDGGDTWPTVSQVAFGPRLEHDKAWLAVSPANKVLLCWDQDAWANGAARDDYTAVTQGSPLPRFPDPPVAVPQQPVPAAIVCAASDDHAKTWTQPATPGGSLPVATDTAFTPWVDFGSDGTAYMSAVDGSHVVFLSSQDGLSWTKPVAIANYTDPAAKIMNGFSTLNGSAFRASAFAVIAADHSGGPRDGSLYVTWMDTASGTGRTMLVSSHDRGTTWSKPTWIHDLSQDDQGQRGDQFMPAVSVGPDGTVDLSWFDRRVDPHDHLFDLYYAYSVDGGRTFSKNLRVSSQSSDEQYSHHQNGAIFLGDYMDIASSKGAAHPVWVDTRNHKADAFTATIERPSANG
jgi:hypothetical protein